MDVRTELKGNTCKSNLDFSASTGDSKKQRGRYGREKENNSQSSKMVSISQIFLFRKKEIKTVYFNQSRFPPVFVLILSMIKSSQVESFLPCKFFLHFPTLVRQWLVRFPDPQLGNLTRQCPPGWKSRSTGRAPCSGNPPQIQHCCPEIIPLTGFYLLNKFYKSDWFQSD